MVTIWRVLLLAPYLALTVMGGLPHRHGCGCCVPDRTPAGTMTVAAPNVAPAGACTLCLALGQWGACSPLTPDAFTAALTPAAPTPFVLNAPSPPVLAAPSSRAPPVC